ncbi:MAG: hypothetical protein JSU69_08675 [Candidatus Zixiibacteriota bacterium]|nr:MAG: hypothetical protein JSU69_08675 [candidate division Zixibacteria bacterium]
MRVTKMLAILFAAILVVFCFNAPAVFSGVGVDGDPWDGDGGGDGDGTGGSSRDSLSSTGLPLRCDSSPSGGGNTGSSDVMSLLKIVSFSFWQFEKIELQSQEAAAVVAKSGE